MPEPKQILRLTSPYGCYSNTSGTTKRVQCDIPIKTYASFFQGTLLGCGRGSQYNVLTSLIEPLITACTTAEIPTSYDPDNEQRVATILSRLNFNDLDAISRVAYRTGYEAGVRDAESRTAQDTVARGAAVKPPRSNTGRTKSGRTTGVHEARPDTNNGTSNYDGKG